jgi:AraC-like DNA-binding protein
MKASDETPPVIQVPYAVRRETRSSARYQWDCARRWSSAFVIVQWTFQGAGRVECKSRDWSVPRHHAFVAIVPEPLQYGYPPGATEPWSFSWVNFYGEISLHLARRFRARFGPVSPLPPGSPAALALQELIDSVADRRLHDPSDLSELGFGFWMKWWKQLHQPSQTPGGVIQSVINHCRDHYRDPVTVKELAVRAGMSREHLTRLFCEKVGVSPAAFLRKQRVEAAADLLRSTPRSLNEIAMRCGFRSARQCREAFQQRYRKSPQVFRARANKAASLQIVDR